jgi:integrase
LYALYVLAAHTGMRQGELLGLKWDALDMDRGTVEVRTNLQRTKAGLELGEPKSRRSRRRISINRTVVQALREHRIRQFEEELSSGPAWRDQRFVFSNEVGGPIEAQNFLRRSFHRVLALSGIPRCRFHDLRHTAISLLLANGVPITTVSEIAGHSRTSVTLDVYGHNMPGGHEQATEMMRKVLG